jgi:four helix bundle protein
MPGSSFHFLFHERGSLLELQTQLLIAEDLQYWSTEEAQRLLARAKSVGRALDGRIHSLCRKVA